VFSKIIEALYDKVLINIVLFSNKTIIYVEILSSKKVIKTVTKEFKTTILNDEIIQFIQLYTAQSPFFYISLLDTSVNQGAISTCFKAKFPLYNVDADAYESRCIDNRWSCYTSRDEIYEIEKKYSNIELDFIFSPFILLANIYKDKIDSLLAMFILVEDNYLSLAVFNKSELLFAQHLDLEHSKDEDMDLYEEDELSLDDNSEDLDPLDDLEDVNDLNLDNLSDIEDLDSLDDIDDFSSTADIEEELTQTEEELTEDKASKEDSGSFNEDYQRFNLIQSSIKEFYENDKFDSEFIENVYIADGIGVSNDLKNYLEDEMFLTVYIRRIELPKELCNIAKKELDI
jgi:hypothetical protein